MTGSDGSISERREEHPEPAAREGRIPVSISHRREPEENRLRRSEPGSLKGLCLRQGGSSDGNDFGIVGVVHGNPARRHAAQSAERVGTPVIRTHTRKTPHGSQADFPLPIKLESDQFAGLFKPSARRAQFGCDIVGDFDYQRHAEFSTARRTLSSARKFACSEEGLRKEDSWRVLRKTHDLCFHKPSPGTLEGAAPWAGALHGAFRTRSDYNNWEHSSWPGAPTDLNGYYGFHFLGKGGSTGASGAADASGAAGVSGAGAAAGFAGAAGALSADLPE